MGRVYSAELMEILITPLRSKVGLTQYENFINDLDYLRLKNLKSEFIELRAIINRCKLTLVLFEQCEMIFFLSHNCSLLIY